MRIGEFGGGNVAEVGAFGEEAADVAVGVFNGAFFPDGIGVGVINFEGGIEVFEETDEGLGVEEFTAVVGGDGADFLEFAGGDDHAQNAADGVGVDERQSPYEEAACDAFGEGYDAAPTPDAGGDGVHLTMPELGARVGGLRVIFEEKALKAFFARRTGLFGFRFLRGRYGVSPCRMPMSPWSMWL